MGESSALWVESHSKKTLRTRWMCSWGLLANVRRQRDGGRSVGAESRSVATPAGSHAKKRLFRRNSWLAPLALHSVDCQLISSYLSFICDDLPHVQSIYRISNHRGATTELDLAAAMWTILKLYAMPLGNSAHLDICGLRFGPLPTTSRA